MRNTYTYAELDLTPSAFSEIKDKLTAAGYGHAFVNSRTIDMHGLAVVLGPPLRGSELALAAQVKARRIVSEVRSPGTDVEKVVKVALMLRDEEV